MPFTASHSFARDSSNHHHRQPLDESCTRTVMIVVNRMLALPSSSSTISTATATPGETPQTKTKAGSILRTTSLAPLYDEIKLTWLNFNKLSCQRWYSTLSFCFRPWMLRIPRRPGPLSNQLFLLSRRLQRGRKTNPKVFLLFER